MTQAPTDSASSSSFGANQWLVDELYEQYVADPDQVDPAWREYFAARAAHPIGTPPSQLSTTPLSTPPAPGHTDVLDVTGASITPWQPLSGSSAGAPALESPSPRASATQPPAAPSPAAATPKPPTRSRAPEQQPPAAHGNARMPHADAHASDAPTPQARPASPRVPSEQAGAVDIGPAPEAAAQPSTAPYAASVRGLDRPRPRRARDENIDDYEGAEDADHVHLLKGPAARVVTNMDLSLTVPTATSVRSIPAKALVDNRLVINNHLSRVLGGKVSFTHLIGFAVVEALGDMPDMNFSYVEPSEDTGGKHGVRKPAHVNFGLAIDLAKRDGTRQLLVPNIKDAEKLDFAGFYRAYEDVVRRARAGALTADDFAGTTITLTNPGTIGTVHSVPRLMSGQGTIIGVGAMEFPAEYQGAAAQALAQLGVSKVLTLTSTYDHRIIQGAQSGDFLRLVHHKLLGLDGFYDRVFQALRVPYEPVRWVQDRVVDPSVELGKPAKIAELIHAYRTRGHLMADTDPLAFRMRRHPDLDMQQYGLTLWDFDREFPTGGFGGTHMATLQSIMNLLRDCYCRTIGVEYMHIQDPKQRTWLQERLEAGYSKPPAEIQRRILNRLNAAEAFETFLQTKYVGQKRFSLEGAESVIPMLDSMLSDAADSGIDEVTIGMAHRGRLNVLSNLAGKSYSQIFREFQGNQDPRTVQGSGDVKYHLGTEGSFTSPTGAQTKVYLAANPSHLEAVDPVLEGIARAKQDRIDLGGAGYPVLPILIHGDAAFAGQGVVPETLNMAQLRGYRTGGTIHVVINNQLGFTTAPSSSRSTYYCTDVAKGFQVPIFHVNGDDPEACARVASLAFDYREEFGRDVVIDLVCYRRRGHNEGDDPSMTQPLMYSLIEGKRSVRTLYTEALVARGDIDIDEAEQVVKDYHDELERVFTETKTPPPGSNGDGTSIAGLEIPESQLEDAGVMVGWRTAVDPEVLARIGAAHVRPPETFTVHPKLASLLERRADMSTNGGIDWGYAEILAFGSLLLEGTPIRLAGQDSRRGTFVQRHAVFHDQVTGAEWTPLLYLSAHQAKLWIYDSALSEYSALGFEYGYSVERPEALVLWEAQFGDFFNGAQTIVDEFISSAEQKWGQRSSLVMLMPHGYEGQGPDHSSGRIERFLQMCAENNMTVAQPSTPASYFHLLRWQAYTRPRHPLVVFTPKSMLRLKAAASAVTDFTSGTFQPIMTDHAAARQGGGIDRVLVCSGKVFHELVAKRAKDESGQLRTAIVRLEQLYPLDADELRRVVDSWPGAEVVWVQDEPENQGAWTYLVAQLWGQLGDHSLRVVSRPASAATATGQAAAHQAEQADLIERAFARD